MCRKEGGEREGGKEGRKSEEKMFFLITFSSFFSVSPYLSLSVVKGGRILLKIHIRRH